MFNFVVIFRNHIESLSSLNTWLIFSTPKKAAHIELFMHRGLHGSLHFKEMQSYTHKLFLNGRFFKFLH